MVSKHIMLLHRLVVRPRLSMCMCYSWRCLPVGTYYPRCQAAKDGVCEALDCSEIAAQDKCDLPSVRKYDALRKTVVQYCSSVCPCDVPDEEEIAVIDELEWMDFQSPSLLGDDICCA
eukprot:jgi/Picre1/33905/NNA_001384.t1